MVGGDDGGEENMVGENWGESGKYGDSGLGVLWLSDGEPGDDITGSQDKDCDSSPWGGARATFATVCVKVASVGEGLASGDDSATETQQTPAGGEELLVNDVDCAAEDILSLGLLLFDFRFLGLLLFDARDALSLRLLRNSAAASFRSGCAPVKLSSPELSTSR